LRSNWLANVYPAESINMDFSWTDEQRDFRDSTINFAKH